MPDRKTRSNIFLQKTEAREAPDGKRYIEGMIPYNTRSVDLGGFVEVLAPTAFNKTLADGSDIFAFWSHESGKVLGSRNAGTLSLENTPEGLRFRIEMRDTAVATDYWETVARGDCLGVSFMFMAIRDEWTTVDGLDVRTLIEARLMEISAGVPFAAYPEAYAIATRSAVAEGGMNLAACISKRNAPEVVPEPAPATAAPPEPDPAPPSPAPEARARAEAELNEAELHIVEAEVGLQSPNKE